MKIFFKTPYKWGIYKPHEKLAVGAVFHPWRLAVDRPGRPPTVKNLTVGALRSTARSTVPIQRANALWPVDRSVDRPSLTVDRSVDRLHPRVGYLQSVDRLKWLASVHVLCTSVDRSGRPPEPGRQGLWTENLGFYLPIKSHKSSKNPQK